jgi:hypothetical protein
MRRASFLWQVRVSPMPALKLGWQSWIPSKVVICGFVFDFFNRRTEGSIAEGQQMGPVAFRRYTVSSYLANFNGYAGQSFTVSSDTRILALRSGDGAEPHRADPG